MRGIKIASYFLSVYIAITGPPVNSAVNRIPQEFEIIHPTVFHSSSGTILPSEITSTHRKKRSALWGTDQISVNISSMIDHYHIKLSLNKKLLSPGFKVYHRHHGNKSHTRKEEAIDDGLTSECHFHGVVESHSDAKAAMSLCGGVEYHQSGKQFGSRSDQTFRLGLHSVCKVYQQTTEKSLAGIETGVLMLPEDDFVIEPLPSHMKTLHHSNHSNDNAHIMYRRSALPHNKFDTFPSKEDMSREPRQNFHRARRKRSYRRTERSVETLVVVDQAMYDSHGRQNLTTYVLSIFNIVSQLYQDSTLGYTIKIVLVGLVILDGDEPGLRISHHADDTLNSFCQWQATVSKRKRHDHAVLLTGVDICSFRNAPCDTLGFAPIEGMCSELRSCIVNEDTGLSTAFTVAHEIGHNFGMLHDGDGNSCHETTGNIMSATLTAQSGIFHWSTCSRESMRNFLNAVQSECLTNQARNLAELKFPDKLPGEIFDADTQCKWQFGKHSKQCQFTRGQDICKNLWCFRDTAMCETKFLPAAEGTSCGYGMWCKQGRCTRYGSRGPTPVNGWWSGWGEWSKCSRSCGGGVKTRKRECNNPRPQYGGKSCEGGDVINKMCNIPECEKSERDFREVQCEEYNRHRFRGWFYRWRAYKDQQRSDVDDQCKLYCKADGYNFYYTMATEVTDGTRCNDYSTNICVQGQCKPVGCDLIVNSTVRKDRCGICDGDNSTCDVIQNTFTAQPRKNTYNRVVVIPKGASSITIQEMGISPNNFLVLRDKYGKYLLNGDWHLNKEGLYNIQGTRFVYRRTYNKPESLEAEGPLIEDLILEVLIQGENLGVQYSFTVPRKLNEISPPRHNYTWSVILTKCTEECAGGKQAVTAHCHRDHREEVDPAYCDPRTKPGTGTFSCNTEPCRPRWATEPWGVCSKPCGGGKQKRRVHCLQRISQKEDRRVKHRLCKKREKPKHKKECNTHECPPVWYKGSWSKCSQTCGKGFKSRHVTCRTKTTAGHVRLRDSMCVQTDKPITKKGCQVRRCPDPHAQWIITAWTKCTGSCGVGIRTRQVKCTRPNKFRKMKVTGDSHCKHIPNTTLPLVDSCKLEPCQVSGPNWYASPWSKCSVTCGTGQQTRLVHCIEKQTKLASDCDQESKPQETQTCEQEKCPSPDPLCVDQFPWCGLVPKHNICHHTFYGTKCCLSCRQRAS